MAGGNRSSARPWAGYLLGFALGGFFDGILLHQILQWHHLLLGIQAGPFADLRTQILADGLFHLLMYVLALAGLCLLWRARQAPELSTRSVLGAGLIGFGAWHVIDAVVSHWILGIHRIKMDSPNPLAWDLFWFVVFGLAPLMFGLLVRARAQSQPPASRGAAAAMSIAVLAAGVVAMLPPRDAEYFVVLVRPADASRLLGGLQHVRGSVLWADRSGALWVLRADLAERLDVLYEHGALWHTRSPAALGCLSWTRTAT